MALSFLKGCYDTYLINSPLNENEGSFVTNILPGRF